jgi:hypothetical protein
MWLWNQKGDAPHRMRVSHLTLMHDAPDQMRVSHLIIMCDAPHQMCVWHMLPHINIMCARPAQHLVNFLPLTRFRSSTPPPSAPTPGACRRLDSFGPDARSMLPPPRPHPQPRRCHLNAFGPDSRSTPMLPRRCRLSPGPTAAASMPLPQPWPRHRRLNPDPDTAASMLLPRPQPRCHHRGRLTRPQGMLRHAHVE